MEIIETLGWKTFTILYEDNASLLRISELLKIRTNKDYRIVVRQLDKDGTGNYRYV